MLKRSLRGGRGERRRGSNGQRIEEINKTTPAWKSESNASTPKKSMTGTWTTTTTDAAMPRKGMAPQCSCGNGRTCPLQQAAPREVVALPGLWLPSRPPQLMSHGYASQAHVAPFTGVNRVTERRARRCRRVSDPRAAETGRRGRRRRENARGQRPSATSKGGGRRRTKQWNGNK